MYNSLSWKEIKWERMNIQHIESAYRIVLSKLKEKGFILDQVIPINSNRYIIAKGKPNPVLILYKREVFYNFGKQFRKEGYKGVGDSINSVDLIKANAMGVKDIYTVFPNGIIYHIDFIEFLDKSIKWKNKEGKEIRSISIHEYKKEFQEKEDYQIKDFKWNIKIKNGY